MLNAKSTYLGATLIALLSHAALAETQLSPDQKAALRLLKKMTESQRQAVLAQIPSFAAQANPIGNSSGADKAKNASGPVEALPILDKSTKASGYYSCLGFVPLLRQNWKDIDFASCPEQVAKATGAQISFTDDRVKNNVNWAIQGTAALLYNTAGSYAITPSATANILTSTGVYVTVNRLKNSALSQASNNADTLSYGGEFEIGTANDGPSTLENPYIGNYVQLRGGQVEDHIKNTTAAAATLQWMPVYDNGILHIHETMYDYADRIPWGLRIDPEALVQYDASTGLKNLLAFNNKQDALRIGPQLTLNLFPALWADPLLARFHANASYHWAYETYSAQSIDFFQTNLVYNLDDSGNFALTGTYQRGHDEDTGQKMNVYKVSLSGKL